MIGGKKGTEMWSSYRHVAKSVSKRAGQNLLMVFHGLLGPKFHPSHKAKLIAECLEDKFTIRDQCDAVRDGPMETRIHTLPEIMGNNSAITDQLTCQLKTFKTEIGLGN